MKEFVDVKALSEKFCSTPITGSLKYATDENFMGRIVNGYNKDASDVFILEKNAAIALCKVQQYLLEEFNFSIEFHDGFRPTRAVKDFFDWIHSNNIYTDYENERKKLHYPDLESKIDMVSMGFVADKVSRHSFGFAVDVTLRDIKKDQELDMGAIFDFFGPISYATATTKEIGENAYTNRKILEEAMYKFGFYVYDKEFWHFDFTQIILDPMNFEITKELKGLNVDTIRNIWL